MRKCCKSWGGGGAKAVTKEECGEKKLSKQRGRVKSCQHRGAGAKAVAEEDKAAKSMG